jgi:type IV pilus assembly protein PilW
MSNYLTMKKLHVRSGQRGMGLVELMISMLIGLILLGSLAYFYLGSRQISRTHDDLSRMEESGRNAMEIIGKAVRQAGFRLDVSKPLYVNPANNIGAIIGTDGGGAAFGLAGAATAPSDTLTIRHDPAWVEDATNPIKGREANCSPVGTNVMVSDNDADTTTGVVSVNKVLVEYSFSIGSPANATLLCSNVAANPAVGGSVVVDNIERMQITYGLRDATGAITSYIAAPTAAQWANVAAVRVSLLVRGPSQGITTNNSQTYIYNGETVTSTDGFLRQVYTSTFTVRNQAL